MKYLNQDQHTLELLQKINKEAGNSLVSVDSIIQGMKSVGDVYRTYIKDGYIIEINKQ